MQSGGVVRESLRGWFARVEKPLRCALLISLHAATKAHHARESSTAGPRNHMCTGGVIPENASN